MVLHFGSSSSYLFQNTCFLTAFFLLLFFFPELPDIWSDQSFLWTTASEFQINTATPLCICLFSSGCKPAVSRPTYFGAGRAAACHHVLQQPRRSTALCSGCSSALLARQGLILLRKQGAKLTSSPCAGLRSQSNPGVGRKQKETWCMETGCL